MAARRGETLCDRGVRARWDVTLHVLLFSISVHWLWYINNLILFVRVHKNYLVRAPRLKAMTAHRWQWTWRDCCVTAGCELLLHVIRVAIICRNTLNCKSWQFKPYILLFTPSISFNSRLMRWKRTERDHDVRKSHYCVSFYNTFSFI